MVNRRFKALPCSVPCGRVSRVTSHWSVMGQSRQFSDVRATSALPLIADVRCEDRQVRKVPITDFTSDGNPVKTRLALPSDPSYGML